MGIGGGGGGGIGAGGADDQYNIEVNIDMKGAQQALAALTALFAANTAAISGNINNINVNLSQMFKTITSQGGQAGQTLGNIATQMHETTGASDKLGISLGGVMTRMLALRTAITTIRELGDSFTAASSKANELGKKRSDMESMLRPVQMQLGSIDEVSPQTIQSHLQMLRMGKSDTEAAKFAEVFAGDAANAIEQKDITEKQFYETQRRMARLSMPYGAEGDAFAKLGGFLTQRIAKATPADEKDKIPERAQAQTAELARIITYAPGGTTPHIKGLTGFLTSSTLEGGSGGNIDDPRAAAALYSMVAQGTTAGRTQTAANQLVRGVFGMTKGTEKFAEWSKEEAGVTDKMDAYERTVRIAHALRKQLNIGQKEAEDAAKDMAQGGEGGKLSQRIGPYLKELGLKDAAVVRVMTGAVANIGTAESLRASTPVDPESIEKGLRKFEGSPSARSRRAEGDVAASEHEQNQRYQERYTLMQQSYASLTRQGLMTPEMMPQRALQDLATARGITGDMTSEQKTVVTGAVQKAVEQYGDFFRLGNKRTITQAEIMAAERSGELTTEMDRAKQRWEAAGRPEQGPMGLRGRRVVEGYRGEGTADSVARDIGEKVRPLYDLLPDIGLNRALSSAERRRREDEENRPWDFARPSPLLPPAVPPGAAMPAEGVPGGPRRGTMERRRAAAHGEPHAGVARPTPGRVAMARPMGVGPERDDPREMPRPGAEFEDGGRGGAGKSDEKMAAAMMAMISHVKRGADAQERMEQKMNDPLPLPGRPTVVS